MPVRKGGSNPTFIIREICSKFPGTRPIQSVVILERVQTAEILLLSSSGS
jgi:hypothetical protein